MASACRLVVNPNNKAQRYVVWDNGHVDAYGGAIPFLPVDWTQIVIPSNAPYGLGPLRALQVIDWTKPSGYFLSWDGVVTAFGGATAPSSQANYSANGFGVAPWKAFNGSAALIAADFSMDPAGNGQGYVLAMGGHVLPMGGANAIPYPGVIYSYGSQDELAVRMQLTWRGDGHIAVMSSRGRIFTANGLPAITNINGAAWDFNSMWGPQWPYYWARDFFIDNYSTGLGWMMDGSGEFWQLNGAQVIGQPYWFWGGTDYARSFAILDDGSGANPLQVSMIRTDGGNYDYTVAVAPTCTVVAPTGTVSVTTRPTISWQYANANGDAQASWGVRVFTNAQHSAGGFDPSTPSVVPYYSANSGPEGFGQPTDHHFTDNVTDRRDLIVDVDFANDTYWPYVQVGSTAGLASSWTVGASFVVNVVRPPTPTLTATPGPDELSGILLVAHTASAPAAGVRFGIQFLDDNGDWQWVRDGEALTPDVGHNGSIVDYEPLYGVARSYRAVAYQGTVNPLVSAFSATVVATLNHRTVWTLIDPFDPAVHAVIHVQPDFAWEEVLDGVVYQPAGMVEAIVMVDDAPVKAMTSTLKLLLPVEDDYTPVRTMLRAGHELLLRDPFGRGWYVMCGSGSSSGSIQWTLVAVPPDNCTGEDQPSGAGFYHQVAVPVAQVALPVEADPTLDFLLAP